MITLDGFKIKLKTDSIKIIEERILDGINIIYISNLPASAKKIKINRRDIYQYDKFMIKGPDKKKFSNEDKSDIEELKLEILAAEKFKDNIPILEKLAIIKTNNKVFLIEELLISYEQLKHNDALNNRALELLKKAKKLFKNGDFKIENIVYDSNRNKLLFTDVFPSEAHLRGE